MAASLSDIGTRLRAIRSRLEASLPGALVVYSFGGSTAYGFRLDDTRSRSWLYVSEDCLEEHDAAALEALLDRHEVLKILRTESPCSLRLAKTGLERLSESGARVASRG